MKPITRIRAVVTGTVQGVGFRYWVARKADGLELTGHARNLFDGTVEVEVEGPEPGVDSLVELLHTGPPTATVSDVKVNMLTPRGQTGRFEILR